MSISFCKVHAMYGAHRKLPGDHLAATSPTARLITVRSEQMDALSVLTELSPEPLEKWESQQHNKKFAAEVLLSPSEIFGPSSKARSSGFDFIDYISMDEAEALRRLQEAASFHQLCCAAGLARFLSAANIAFPSSTPQSQSPACSPISANVADSFNLRRLVSYRNRVTRNLAPTVAKGFMEAKAAAAAAADGVWQTQVIHAALPPQSLHHNKLTSHPQQSPRRNVNNAGVGSNASIGLTSGRLMTSAPNAAPAGVPHHRRAVAVAASDLKNRAWVTSSAAAALAAVVTPPPALVQYEEDDEEAGEEVVMGCADLRGEGNFTAEMAVVAA